MLAVNNYRLVRPLFVPVALDELAIHAQDLIAFWIALVSEPPLQMSPDDSPLVCSSAVDMVDGQRLKCCVRLFVLSEKISTLWRVGSRIVDKEFKFRFVPRLGIKFVHPISVMLFP